MKSKWRLPLIVVLVAVGLGGTLVYFRSPPPVNLLLITLDIREPTGWDVMATRRR